MFERVAGGETLGIERATLLWCLRIWGMGARRPAGACWNTAEFLCGVGAAEAAAPFDTFMRSVAEAARRPLHIACVAGRHITQDESALLDVLALAQGGRGFEMLLLLRECLSPAGALAAAECARDVARALARAGLFLDAPEVPAHRCALFAPAGEIRPAIPLFGFSA